MVKRYCPKCSSEVKLVWAGYLCSNKRCGGHWEWHQCLKQPRQKQTQRTRNERAKMDKIQDEPTVEEVNESTKHLFAGMAFDAILKNDEDKAKKLLTKLNAEQLQDIEYACNWLGRLAKEVFFNR